LTPHRSTSRIQKGYILLLLLLLLPFLAVAQEDFDPDTDDITPATPIDDYIILALLLVIYYTYRFIKLKNIQKN
jgi:hypothetical protein